MTNDEDLEIIEEDEMPSFLKKEQKERTIVERAFFDVEPPEEKAGSIQMFLKSKTFLLLWMVMLCGGAAEQSMSQWASEFAESALGIDKATGDLLGPCLFAVLMGSARVFYGKFSTRVNLDSVMQVCCVLCMASYLLTALSPIPALSLVGCAVCGLSVGVFWPGILSSASRRLPGGGIPMFAILALAGDLGCLLGPSLAGWIAELFGGDLRAAFVFAVIFPLACFCLLGVQNQKRRRN